MKAMTSSRLRKRIFSLLAVLTFGIAFRAVPARALDPSSCIKHEEHERVTFLLIDRSDKLKDPQGLSQTLQAVREMLSPSERIVVGISAGSLSETRIAMDVVRPKGSMWEAVMKTRAKEKAFGECFARLETSLTAQEEEHKTSAVLETLSFAAMNLSADKSTSGKRLVIFSDMVQNSPSLSFFAAKTVDPAQSLAKAEKEKLVAGLSGVDVYVSGAGIGVVDEKARKIEEFWRGYFAKSGAELKFYGPIFVGS